MGQQSSGGDGDRGCCSAREGLKMAGAPEELWGRTRDWGVAGTSRGAQGQGWDLPCKVALSAPGSSLKSLTPCQNPGSAGLPGKSPIPI